MILKNLTSMYQSVTVEDTRRRQIASIGIAPFGEFILPEGMKVLDQFSLSGRVSLGEGGASPVILHESHEEVQEAPEIMREETVEVAEPVAEIAEDNFICEICGAEFASARGLNSHKNRAHS